LRSRGCFLLFDPADNQFPNGALDQLTLIYASAPRYPGVALEQDEASKSKRPLQTITPLAQELNVGPVQDLVKGRKPPPGPERCHSDLVTARGDRRNRSEPCGGQRTEDNDSRPLAERDRFDTVWIFDTPAKGKGHWKFSQVRRRLRDRSVRSSV
jgi:hypothetical protein